ncbi:queuosine precursor transporter [Pelagibacterium lentulum]|uniref:Probable queuosine precursor transporter n=1 Tax=Pelagibacterium lentulum TaxID=2029865 RepID=A0A916R595_9HYPH|nr:queuosine precursor transporter [Pelagibacterium lentulum]GGA35096.1 membrane protein [Pelagibacterium lentulum]
MVARFSFAVLAMAVVVTASNFLVQFPLEAQIGAIDLAEILTWGAFTYPIAFLVNDLTNRHFGPKAARIVVLVGFAIAVVMSIFLASPRIAIASGAAFLTAQLLDVSIFDRLRHARWWKGPLLSSTIGSVVDTILFFGIAFAASFAFLDTGLGREDGSLGFAVPFLSVGGDVPLWVSLAAGDFIVKMLVAVVLLAPYKLLRAIIPDRTALA